MDYNLLAHVNYSLCYIKGCYHYYYFKMMIDSGAQISVISTSMVNKLNLHHKVDKNFRGEAKGVGTATIVGCLFELNIQLTNGLNITNNFKVMQLEMDMVLLGMDFLTHYNGILNIGKRELIVNNQVIQLMNEGEIDFYKHVQTLNVELIRKIILNIILNPQQEKFKMINTKSLKSTECDYLKCLGFVETNERLKFTNDVTVLQHALELIV